MKSIYELMEYIGVPMRGVMKPQHPYYHKRFGPRKPPKPGLNRSEKLEGHVGHYDGRRVESRYD